MQALHSTACLKFPHKVLIIGLDLLNSKHDQLKFALYGVKPKYATRLSTVPEVGIGIFGYFYQPVLVFSFLLNYKKLRQ